MQRIGFASASGSTNSLQFLNIPQTFQDLMLVIYGRSAQAVTSPQFYVYENNDTSTNRSRTVLQGNGSAASSYRETGSPFIASGYLTGASATSNLFGVAIVHYLSYANTNTFKSPLARAASDLNGSGRTELQVKLWPSTNAISSLYIFNDGNSNWAAGTTAELFGIKASAA